MPCRGSEGHKLQRIRKAWLVPVPDTRVEGPPLLGLVAGLFPLWFSQDPPTLLVAPTFDLLSV